MERMSPKGKGYTCRFLGLLIVDTLALAFTIFLHYVGNRTIDIGWFDTQNDTYESPYTLDTNPDVNESPYPIDIQPSSFTAFIWPLIYLWQAVWIIYLFVCLCRRNRGEAVFINPPVVSPFFLGMFLAHMMFNAGLYILLDNRLIVWFFFDSFLTTISIYLMLFIHHQAVDKYGCQLLHYQTFDLWANRILIQNGLALYAAWSSIQFILHLTQLLAYGGVMTSSGGNIDQSTASTFGIAAIGFLILLYFFIENFVCEKYLRYTYTVWAAFLWVTIGIIVKFNFRFDTNTFIAFGLLGLTFVLFIAKMILSIWRSHTKPLYTVIGSQPEMV